MQFVNPWFLLGLIAIAIPIIVHLFNFRRFKKVFFTNVRFIEELQLKTQKQSRLKHLLVLLMRILAIFCIVLAFAQPYIPHPENPINEEARNAVSVYIDNSFSMEASAASGSLLDEARRKAREITDAFKPSDVFQLITNDFDGVQQRWVSRDEFLEMVDEVKISPASRKISDVISRMKDLKGSSGARNRSHFLVSDFQKTAADFESIRQDSAVSTFMVPLTGKSGNNVYIDSCWFDTPLTQLSQQVRLQVRIRNSSAIDYEKVPVKLMINGIQRAVASFDCKSGESVMIPLSFTADTRGLQQAFLELSDYPVTFDDRFYFSFQVGEPLPVLCISDKTESIYLNALFANDSAINYRSVTIRTIDYSGFAGNDLILLNGLPELSSGLTQELHKFLKQGGSVAVFMSDQINPVSWNAFLQPLSAGMAGKLDTAKSGLNPIDPQSELFTDVFERIPENMDLPVNFKHIKWMFPAQSGTEVLLQHENGDPFLLKTMAFAGKLYVFPFPLIPSFTNFMKHSLFVPVMYKIAMLSNVQPRLSYTVGEDEAIVLRDPGSPGEHIFHIREQKETGGFIPEVRPVDGQLHVFAHDQIDLAGNYFLTDGNADLKAISFNFSRRESAMDFYSPEELKSMNQKYGLSDFYLIEAREKPIAMEITSMNKGLRYWKLFVILALLCVAAEIALIRLWK